MEKNPQNFLILILIYRGWSRGAKVLGKLPVPGRPTIAQPFYYMRIGWLVGCFGFHGTLRQYFSLYRTAYQREGEREEKG